MNLRWTRPRQVIPRHRAMAAPCNEAEHPGETFQPTQYLSRQDFARLAMDYLVFGNLTARVKTAWAVSSR